MALRLIENALRKIPLSTALLDSLKTYDSKTLRGDLTAGLIVSLVALPLSMALSIAVGLPPQHGLYTAIVAGIACAIFGGSSTQVSGPTAAFVVIIAPIVSEFGLNGIIWCQILSGIMLITLGVARLGRFIRYVPYPVVTGFTAGIAVTIATLALNDFFGLGIAELKGHYIDKATLIIGSMPNMDWREFAVGSVTLLTIFLLPKITPRIPASVAGIAAGLALSYFLSVDTLMTRFSFATPDGDTLQGIPPYAPHFALPEWQNLKDLIVPSLLIASLAALESLLSATVADSIAHMKHDPDAELNGIGIANILSGLAAGIPATGAIARTSANIHSGARTPVASIFHAVLLLIYMVTLAPYISHMPMAALAALLISVAWRMSHAKQCIAILRVGTRSEAVVLSGTFLLTVFIDMVAGVLAGMVLSFLLLRHSFSPKD